MQATEFALPNYGWVVSYLKLIVGVIRNIANTDTQPFSWKSEMGMV
jgi:hypothetical protein